MKVVQPVAVTDAILVSSSVAEADHSEWSALTTYASGERVIRVSTHRIYESAIGGNLGNDPADPAVSQWIDIGPTNRWAMFDEAVGSATGDTGSIEVTLAPGAIDAVAVLEADADTVQVRVIVDGIAVHDETQPVAASVLGARRRALTFLDLPQDDAAEILVTITGTGPIAAGAVLIGTVLDLGETEASPSIGITDYSRRETDDFGVTTIVERSWAKTMSLRSQVNTDEVDQIQQGMAALRAKAALWIGEEGYDSLIVYGFFKTFSVDLALPIRSYCSFSIEGLAA